MVLMYIFEISDRMIMDSFELLTCHIDKYYYEVLAKLTM